MSPEAIKLREYSEKSDVWAFGMFSCVEVVCGFVCLAFSVFSVVMSFVCKFSAVVRVCVRVCVCCMCVYRFESVCVCYVCALTVCAGILIGEIISRDVPYPNLTPLQAATRVA